MPLVSSDVVSQQSFDYIIVGGGTAGLVVAARLSEDPEISVLVLEAGPANLNDELLLRPAQFGQQLGKPNYDWTYQTREQEHLGGTKVMLFSGKGLGGGSAINLMCWTKPPSDNIDDLEKLGNPGWNWKNYEKYIKKAEKFIYVPKEGHEFNASNWNVGDNGPLAISHPKNQLGIELKAYEALRNRGIPPAHAPLSGDPDGVTFVPNTIDAETLTRSYATTAYFLPNETRPNFFVLVSAMVHRLLFSDHNVGDVLATGVEFECNGKIHSTFVKREVIVAAGSLKSPHILEMSGIGRRSVLEKINIPVKVELQGVGENLQEHHSIGVSWELPEDFPDDTFDVLRNPDLVEKQKILYAAGSGVYTMGITLISFSPLQRLSDRADVIHHAAREKIMQNASQYPPGRLGLLNLQLDRLKRQSPGCETICVSGYRSTPKPPVPGKKYFSFVAAANHPFSRGTVHAISPDPRIHPEINPHYFEEDIDLQTMLEIVKFIRKMPTISPFKEALGGSINEYNPGPEVQGDEDIIDWLKKYIGSTYHPAGTCAMLPREKDGVVSPELKVYGTKNVRVVDHSIIPVHYASHAQATVYAIGEQVSFFNFEIFGCI